MGRLRKRHNLKARQKVDTNIDKSEQQKINQQLEGYDNSDYEQQDEANVLALPSKKRKTKVKIDNQDDRIARRLSKTQRKKLEKIVEHKEKKGKRAELLEKLKAVQATPNEMQMLTSTSDMYTGKQKRRIEIEELSDGKIKINAISGSNKKRRLTTEDEQREDTSSSSEEDEEEEEEGEASPEVEQDNHQPDTAKDSAQTLQTSSVSKSIDNVDVTEMPKIESHPAVHIPLQRKPKIQAQRLKLPILGEEQVIMEAISENPVVVLCGETGSGKTTQVPQFLYEAGYAHGGGIIAVTEPRRVAAISMSKRVAEEMALSSREVSYQIRYEGNVTEDTKIKFMTDGVLLKEVQKDFMLNKYKVVIIDEAHERSVYTDILIGLLSRIVPMRQKMDKPLKLIIMSATLRIEDFTENRRLFKVPPPVIKIDSRQYPVMIHFNKRTPLSDYLGEAYSKICKVHRQLPEGGILVFVTGQQEVHTLCAKLRRSFPFETDGKSSATRDGTNRRKPETEKKIPLPDIKLEDYSALPLDEEAEIHDSKPDEAGELSDVELHSDEDDEDLGSVAVSKINENEQPLYVLPMYSLLSADRQAKVFQPPPDGTRMCVIATNVAETSLTIPNIKYVIDTGKVKTKFYEKVTGVAEFRVTWTSKASANQRAGRSGRTGPGHTYRLYSSAVFNDEFEDFSPPEITRRPIDDLVLQMKAMHIDKVINFPFPTPPDQQVLKAAEKLLVSLGALEKPPVPKSFKESKMDPSTKITPLGRAMATFPVSPRYGKMLSLGSQHQLLPYVVAIVAALSVQEVFVEIDKPPGTDEEKEEQKNRRLKAAHTRSTWAGSGNSRLLGDLMVMLKALGAWEYSGGSVDFCESHGLRYKAMNEIRKLRAQLTNTVNSVLSGSDLVLDPQMKPPTDIQAKLLRQIILAGLGDHIARRLPEPPKGTEDYKKLKHSYQSLFLEDPVFIHPGSVLYRSNHEYVVYQSVEETSKLYMKGVSAIESDWLPLFVPNHCDFSSPLEKPCPRYDESSGNVLCHMTSTCGPHFWPLPAVELDFPGNMDKYKWFARFLLDGQVCPKLVKFVPTLLTSPVTMIKTWAKLQPRTEKLLNALISERVDSRERLYSVWKKNPKYLLKAYSEWLPEILGPELAELWPPT